MSDPKSNSEPSEKHPVYDVPGCGFLGYSCLLLGVFLIGVIGLAISSIGLLSESYRKKPYYLTPGRKVEVWRLQPMRDVKLLQITEVPEYLSLIHI